MATRNEGGELKKTLNSLYDSIDKYDPEIIVVDDYSMDGSCNFIDSHILLVHNHKQMGMSRSRECGLKMSSGEVLCILDPHMSFPKGLFGRLYDIAVTGCFTQPKIGRLAKKEIGSWEAGISWNSKTKHIQSKWENNPKNQALMCPAWAFPRKFLDPILKFYDNDAFWWMDDSAISAWTKLHSIPIIRIKDLVAGHLFKSAFDKTWGMINSLELNYWNCEAYKRIFHPQTCKNLFGISWGQKEMEEDSTKTISDYEFFCSIVGKEKVISGKDGSVMRIDS